MEYVLFPGLGLEISVNRVAFSVFGFDIYTYAIIISFSLLLSLFLSIRASEKYGISQNDFMDMMIVAIPMSIICARLYYVIFSWDNYRGDFLSIINLRNGGLAIYGAVIGAFLAVFICGTVKKINPFKVLDFGVPYLIMSQGIGRWANFVNQEAFSGNTMLPWGMTSDAIVNDLTGRMSSLQSMGILVDPAMPVHPTFLYESLWNFFIAALLFRRRKNKKYTGEVTLFYLIGYGVGRMFIEDLRMDSLMYGSVRVSQALSAVLVVVCVCLCLVFRKKRPAFMELEPALSASADAAAEDMDIEGAETAGGVVGDVDDLEKSETADTDDTDNSEESEPDDIERAEQVQSESGLLGTEKSGDA